MIATLDLAITAVKPIWRADQQISILARQNQARPPGAPRPKLFDSDLRIVATTILNPTTLRQRTLHPKGVYRLDARPILTFPLARASLSAVG